MALSLVMLFLVLVSGCGGDKDTGNEENSASGSQLTKQDCGVLLDTSAWDVFSDLARRASAGTEIPASEYNQFGNQPTMNYWIKSASDSAPPPKRIGHWVELTFWQELGLERPRKPGGDLRVMMTSYRYSYENTDRINQFITDYSNNQESCKMLALAQKWVSPETLPNNPTIHFLPAKAELRIFENHILVDTGSAVSASPGQLNRQIASLFYRGYGSISGDNPIDTDGGKSIANSLRTLCNEGYASWIGDMTNVYFFKDHPTLGAVEMAAEDSFHKGREVISKMNTKLAPVLDSETKIQEMGQNFSRDLASSHSFTRGGYAMVATIAGHLGEERLIKAQGSVSDFLAAFQEAALMNPVPAPVPGRPGVANHQTLPALYPEVYEWLMEQLAKEGL